MLLHPHLPLAEPVVVPLANLAAVDATHLLRSLTHSSAPLVLDCGALPCQRTLGVCFLVSLLLLLRQGGARVYLRNASPVLQRCLEKLKLGSLFLLTE